MSKKNKKTLLFASSNHTKCNQLSNSFNFHNCYVSMILKDNYTKRVAIIYKDNKIQKRDPQKSALHWWICKKEIWDKLFKTGKQKTKSGIYQNSAFNNCNIH